MKCRINEFFENEVNPVLQHLQKGNTKAAEIVNNYFSLVRRQQ